ncbi:MAG: hypothetical protein EBZ60_05790 [Betaproteobacteria bacterium]|nr:hypothetical protein [Betaproteobacteria bacterium]
MRLQFRFKWLVVDLEHLVAALAGLVPAIAKCVRNVIEAIQLIVVTLIIALFLLLIAVILWSISEAWRYGIAIAVYETAYGTQVMVDAIIKAIDKVASWFSSFHINPVTYADKISEFKSPHVCDPFDSYEAVIFYLVRLTFSRHVCPAMRYIYGTPLETMVWPFMRPFSFDPAPEKSNCREPSNSEYCIWFIELWRLVAIACISLAVITVIGPLFPLVLQLLRIAVAFMTLGVEIIYHAILEFNYAMHPHMKHGKELKTGHV